MPKSSIRTKADEEVLQNVNKICRACTIHYGKDGFLIPISKEVKGITNGDDKFLIIDELNSMNVGMEDDADLPQQICKTCVDLLQSAHAFRLLVKNSQISLKKRFSRKQNPGTGNMQLKEFTKLYEEVTNSTTFEFNFIDVSETKSKENEIDVSKDEYVFNSYDNDNEQSDSSIGNEKPFECWYCEEAFESVKELQKHEKKHKEEKPVQCKVCKKYWKSLYDYNVHMRSHQLFSNDTFICEQCGELFKKSIRLSKHLKNNLCGKGRKKPTFKVKTATDSTDIKQKECANKYESKNYKCPFCERKFIIPQGLEKHMKLHDKNRKYRCNLCDLAYTRNDHLLRHMNEAHFKTIKYDCPICNKVFLNDAARNRHVKYHDNKSYACGTCGKKFKTVEFYKVHLRSHTGEKAYSCTVCGEKFFEKSCLKRHLLIHSKEQHQYANEVIIAKALTGETTNCIKVE